MSILCQFADIVVKLISDVLVYSAAKEQKKTQKAQKKPPAPKAKAPPKAKAAKVTQKSAPRVGGKR